MELNEIEISNFTDSTGRKKKSFNEKLSAGTPFHVLFRRLWQEKNKLTKLLKKKDRERI